MRRNTLKLSISALLFSCTTLIHAQFGEVADIMKASADDASLVLNEYLMPIGKSWTNALGAGWYNTAKTHKFPGFDLTVCVHFVKTPTSDQVFDMANLGLSKIKPAGTGTEFPRITNGSLSNSFTIQESFTYPDPDNPTQTLTETIDLLPQPVELKGFDIPVGIPLPTAQLGIGLPKNTDLMIRFIPKIELGDFGQLGLFGIGLKHDIKQWIPVVKDLPFDAAFAGGFTKFSMNVGIPFDPAVDYVYPGYEQTDDQALDMSMNALNLSLVVSKKLLFITPYLGFGLTTGKFNLKLAGQYRLPAVEANIPGKIPSTGDPLDPEGNYQAGKSEVISVLSPESAVIDGLDIIDTKITSPQMVAGLRIKLAILTLHAAYTIQEYPMVTAGFGLTIR